MPYTIQKIIAQDTYPVRHQVLRSGKPIESCQFQGDELETTHHLGYYLNKQIIGVISLFEIDNNHFLAQKSIQIRGMAVLPSFQKQGIGKVLVSEAEKFSVIQKADLIWFNARTTAVGFYKKMGYEIVGTEFEIKEVGPHFLMYKNLMK
ncbi:MAG: GNAT family N-acetyltransferase [Flavobacterium sp.]|nr:GNAT family N-acetyltransferase [Flavobacterium sp.]